MNELTSDIAEQFNQIMQRQGIQAALAYLDSLHIQHKAFKFKTTDFLIADNNARLQAKAIALKIPPHIHTALQRQLGIDTTERAYDTALGEQKRDTVPRPKAGNDAGRSAGDRNIGKAYPGTIDPTWGVAVKAMRSSDQIELTHRRAEALGLSPYLISGLSRALGDGWPHVLDNLAYAWTGVPLKP